jgi:hypothetical protein
MYNGDLNGRAVKHGNNAKNDLCTQQHKGHVESSLGPTVR